ncbi:MULTISPECIES: P-loop NTPase fold protein [Pirellulaceae]|nr:MULTISPECIES: P-loop NTPase fold protein [Pirellulaceae]
MPENQISKFEEFAKKHPQTTALSDHPLGAEHEWLDRFNFPFQLGAIYDIIRSNDTKTPLSIGIYGDWGTGKTSAMKWLDGLLGVWNENLPNGQAKVIPVWFYPWKYQTRDDVWRGIVAEVIIATMNVEHASPERVFFAVKRFGAFLGRSFVRALSTLKVKAKDPTGVFEGEAACQPLEKILEDYQDLNHPERALLNRFEQMLTNWVRESLANNERIVLFVDDLDRCLPEVTLEVLEAIKLYLNIPGLIFVVGLDRSVVESVVVRHYDTQGVGEEKAREYLAKMFQVDVNLFRMQHDIENFLSELLERFSAYKEHVSSDAKNIFSKCFVQFSGDSPREVKRVINAAMIAARGWTIFDMGEGEDSLTFEEGLQRHFIRLQLTKNGEGRLLSRSDGNEFLHAWSVIVSNPAFPKGLTEENFQSSSDSLDVADREEFVEQGIPGEREYAELWVKYASYRCLLKDKFLGDILSVCEFRTTGELISQESRTPSVRVSGRQHVMILCSSSNISQAKEIDAYLHRRGCSTYGMKFELDRKYESRKEFAERVSVIIEQIKAKRKGRPVHEFGMVLIVDRELARDENWELVKKVVDDCSLMNIRMVGVINDDVDDECIADLQGNCVGLYIGFDNDSAAFEAGVDLFDMGR